MGHPSTDVLVFVGDAKTKANDLAAGMLTNHRQPHIFLSDQIGSPPPSMCRRCASRSQHIDSPHIIVPPDRDPARLPGERRCDTLDTTSSAGIEKAGWSGTDQTTEPFKIPVPVGRNTFIPSCWTKSTNTGAQGASLHREYPCAGNILYHCTSTPVLHNIHHFHKRFETAGMKLAVGEPESDERDHA